MKRNAAMHCADYYMHRYSACNLVSLARKHYQRVQWYWRMSGVHV